jgi:4-hydroxy-L-threonine phosphate dehydrogenase PdxA
MVDILQDSKYDIMRFYSIKYIPRLPMKMSKKHKMMAYILNTDPDMGYNQAEIGKLMKVAQSTIHRAVKDTSYEVTIRDLSHELEQAKQDLRQLGYEKTNILPPHRGDTFDME